MMKKQAAKAIAYYRVSTARQGQSGLGLEAQRASVENYCRAQGLRIASEYTEVESGKNSARPEIAKAIEAAKDNAAVLVIAKLDRLARNVAFISKLMEAKVKFVAVDMPEANELVVHIMAAMAEHEARAISQRTRAALAAAKRRGVILGKPENLTPEAAAKGRAVIAAAAREAYRPIAGYVSLLRQNGESLRAIADTLNGSGHKTRTGKKFASPQVLNILRYSGKNRRAASALSKKH